MLTPHNAPTSISHGRDILFLFPLALTINFLTIPTFFLSFYPFPPPTKFIDQYHCPPIVQCVFLNFADLAPRVILGLAQLSGCALLLIFFFISWSFALDIKFSQYLYPPPFFSIFIFIFSVYFMVYFIYFFFLPSFVHLSFLHSSESFVDNFLPWQCSNICFFFILIIK